MYGIECLKVLYNWNGSRSFFIKQLKHKQNISDEIKSE